MKSPGLYENSVIVPCGDHYGVSNSRNQNLAELVGKAKAGWNDFDNADMQRVPYMIHVPSQENDGVNCTYGGQADASPTFLHLFGVDMKNYIQLGQDLFSKQRNQIVAFRNGNVITPKYTILDSSTYDTKTGTLITEPTEEVEKEVADLKAKATKQLEMPDQIIDGGLFHLCTSSGLKPVSPEDYDYKNQLQQLETIEEEKGEKSTSAYSKDNNKSTADECHTDGYQDYQKTGK